MNCFFCRKPIERGGAPVRLFRYEQHVCLAHHKCWQNFTKPNGKADGERQEG
jgi:hypothetical protein